MQTSILLLTLMTLLSWGTSTFLGKLASNKIGEKATFYDIIGYFLGVVIYCLIVFKFKNLINVEKSGMIIAFISGLVGTFGLVGFYLLLNKAEASAMIPLTALYPAVAAILAFIFLHETITLPKILGIIFSLVAIYLLSK